MGVQESVLTLLGACTTLPRPLPPTTAITTTSHHSLPPPRPSPPTTAITATSHKSLPPPLSRQSVNRFDVESALEEQALQAALARSLKQEKPRVSCSVVVHARHKYKVYVLICTAALGLVSGVPIVLLTSLFPSRPSTRDTHAHARAYTHTLTHTRTHTRKHSQTYARTRTRICTLALALRRSHSHSHSHSPTLARTRCTDAAKTQRRQRG